MEFPSTAELIGLLGQSVERIRSLRWRNDYAAEGGSAAHTAWVSLQTPGGSVAFHAYAGAAGQIGAAEDNVLALELLLEDGVTSIAPFVVARAAIEASGRAFMLLDPQLTDKQRSELAVAEKLHELKTLETLMLAHDPSMSEEGVRSDLDDVRKRIRALKSAAGQEGLAVPASRPSFTDVVRDVLSPRDDPSYGLVAGASYSSLAHAVPHILVAHSWSLDSRLGHEWGVGFPELDYTTIRDLVQVVQIAFVKAISRQVDAYGWPPSSWTRWRRHVRATLLRSLRAPKVPGQ